MRLPKMPWQRREEQDTEGGEQMGSSYYDQDETDEQEDEDTAGDEPEDTEDEALADLDDDTRARVQEYAARRAKAAVDQQVATWRTPVQARGLDFAQDGTVLVADPQKFAEFASGFRQPPPVSPPAANSAPQPDEDPRPDHYSDPEAFIEWTERRAEKRATALLEAKFAELTPRLEQQEQWRLSQAERQALDRVQQLIPDSAFSQVGAPEYQEAFQSEFLRLLRGTNPEFWANDADLEILAAATIPKVLPRGQQQRDQQGRYTNERGRNAMLYQQSHQAHPDGARAPRNPQPSREEEAMMKTYDMTPEELVALSGPVATIDDFRRAQKPKGKK